MLRSAVLRRALGFLLVVIGFIIFDDVVLPAKQGDHPYQEKALAITNEPGLWNLQQSEIPSLLHHSALSGRDLSSISLKDPSLTHIVTPLHSNNFALSQLGRRLTGSHLPFIKWDRCFKLFIWTVVSPGHVGRFNRISALQAQGHPGISLHYKCAFLALFPWS